MKIMSHLLNEFVDVLIRSQVMCCKINLLSWKMILYVHVPPVHVLVTMVIREGGPSNIL